MSTATAELAYSGETPRPMGNLLGRSLILVLPSAVLLIGAIVAGPAGVPAGRQWLLWLGAALLFLTAMILVPQPKLSAPSTGLAIIALYVLTQVWLWYCLGSYHRHWYPHFAVGALLVVPIGLFAAVTLVRSGVQDLRRARLTARRLVARTDWPFDLNYCAALPEVVALRDAVHGDASPALALVDDPRPAVRVAALSAVAFRRHWQPGQAELIRMLAERADAPEVRAAAIRALAFSRDRQQVETLAQFLRDRSPIVRRAVAEVLFWDGERRWPFIRFGVHEALADPTLRDDGALPLAGATLPSQALADLADWSAEGGAQGVRAAVTLAAYYGHALSAGPNENLVAEIRRKLLDTTASTVLRMELAQLLLEHRLIDGAAMGALLLPDQPAPLRLVAADTVLADGPSDDATAALFEIARRPNREIALAVAQVVQRRLNVDLGVRTPPPPVQSRQAAEITRRVMEWAANGPPDSDIVIPDSPMGSD